MTKNAEHKIMLLFTDDTFKNFYQKHPKERNYLFSKVHYNDLVEFSKTKFILNEVLQCVYVQEYINKKGITKEEFKKNVLDYVKNVDEEKGVSGVDKEEIKRLNDKELIRKYASLYVDENPLQLPVKKGEKSAGFESFRPDQYKLLKKVFSYIFEKENAMHYFKEGKPYNLNAIEAMLMVYILDDINKDDVKHITTAEGCLISRRFMNVLKNYAYEIAEIRNIEYDDEERSITDIYKERFKELKSDLSVIIKMLNDADIEFKKDDEVDFDEIIKTSKKCINKLDKFAFRCRLINTESDD